MTEKEINTSATGLLVLILPFALLIVLLFKAWPVLLALFVLSITLNVWQKYQWERWSRQVNPYFNQLIKENQGCLTPLDLAMKASISGSSARQYLDKKAEEFGAQLREYEGKGTVYYFLTASALGSMFDDSEPPLELEAEAEENITTPALQVIEPHSDDSELSADDRQQPPEPSFNAESELVTSIEDTSTEHFEADLEPPKPQHLEHVESFQETPNSWEDAPNQVQTEFEPPQLQELEHVESLQETQQSWEDATNQLQPELEGPQLQELEHVESLQETKNSWEDATNQVQVEIEPPKLQELEHVESLQETQESWEDAVDEKKLAFKPLIQAELAKRLDVHSSTVGKRKSDDDFPEWSQSRDPEGIAWKYSPETKEFLALETIPELE